MKKTSCECKRCRSACESGRPCWPTPEQGRRLKEAHPDKVVIDTSWFAGIKPIRVIRPAALGEAALSEISDYTPGKQCVFYVDRRCALHYTDLKPMEGRLSTHEMTPQQSMDLRMSFARMWADR